MNTLTTRFLIVILAVCFVFSGCEFTPDPTGDESGSDVNTYIELAESFLDKGDTANAISILEEGLEKTGSKKISKMLNALKETAATTAPVTEPATEPPVTEPATVPTEPGNNHVVGEQSTNVLNNSNQKTLNVFISNFAEQRFEKYPATNDYDLLQFVHIFCQINRHDLLSVSGNSELITKASVDNILYSFFGRTVTPSDSSMIFYNPDYSNEYIIYRNNTYEFIAAYGEFRDYVAIVSKMNLQSDGNYLVEFDIYADYNYNVSQYYGYTSAQARSSTALTYIQSGQAILKTVKYGDTLSYQVISYITY